MSLYARRVAAGVGANSVYRPPSKRPSRVVRHEGMRAVTHRDDRVRR